MDPLHNVEPGILAELRHLDITGYIRVKDTKVVSTGSFGDISKGRFKRSDGKYISVAIKRLRICGRGDITTLFEKEIYVWSKLRHPNIVGLIGYAFDGVTGFPMFISPWMSYGPLTSYLKAETRYDALHLVVGIAEGLGYLHGQGVVHSDIKSDNVLVSRSGRAAICDFGLSRMVAASRSLGRLTSTLKGTSRYLAYELLASSDKNSEKSDVWAFGMIVYEILTRQLPYANYWNDGQISLAIVKGELPSLPSDFDAKTTVEPGIKPLLWEVCQSCWVREPLKRSTMSEVLDKLRVAQSRRLPPLQRKTETNAQDGPSVSRKKFLVNDIPTLNDMYADGRLSTSSDIQPVFKPVHAYLDLISVFQGDITELDVDAIVYEPDSYLRNREYVIEGSISSKIHHLAGPEFKKEFERFSLDYGAVRMTSGHKLFAKQVIHARGPGPIVARQVSLGAALGNKSQLGACYRRSLELANNNSFKSVAFSSISTYEGEFPIEDAARIALEETRRFLETVRFSGALRLSRIIFVLAEGSHREEYEKLVPLIFPPPRSSSTTTED